MAEVREAFVGIEFAKLRDAVAVADAGRDGEARFYGEPEPYELLEAEGIGYAIRLPANAVLQERIAHLLTRPVGRPPKRRQVIFASFGYQAQSWTDPRPGSVFEQRPGR